jgi:hypothetical protein
VNAETDTDRKEIKARQEETWVCLEKWEANPKELETVAEFREVPKEETEVETIESLEDQYGDRHLALGCLRKPKKRMQGDGGSPQKTAVARRRLTLHVVHARRKNRGNKTPSERPGIQQQRK